MASSHTILLVVTLTVLISCVISEKPRNTAKSKQVCFQRRYLANGYYADASGNRVGRHVQPGHAIYPKCNDGYGIIGPRQRLCDRNTQRFNKVAPVCKDVDECSYDWPFSTVLESSGSEPESTLQEEKPYILTPPYVFCHRLASCRNTIGSYRCQCPDGYEGDGVFTCRETNPSPCQPLEPPIHGSMTGNPTLSVKFSCDTDYRIYGSRSLECVDGAWKGLQPVCNVIGCGPLAPLKNGFTYGTRYDVGDSVQHYCHAGYELVGSKTRTCLSDFSWSGVQPTCRTIDRSASSIASKIKTDFINHLEVFTHAGRGRLAAIENIGLDLVFAYDRSASLNPVNFERGLNFTKSLLRQFGVSYDKGGTRVAAVSFADTADIEFRYGPDADTLDEVVERIGLVKNNLGGGTALADAMQKVIDLTDEMRSVSKRALFIMTDGHVTVGDDPGALAMSLRIDLAVEIFVVAVGRAIDRSQLRKIASQPYATHIFHLDNFEDLSALAEIISEKGVEFRRCGQAGNLEIPQMATGHEEGSGNNTANQRAWPWLAQIVHLPDNTSQVVRCGGALLCDMWVVTAGICVFDLKTFTVKPEMLRVRLGAYQLGVTEDAEQSISVSEVHLPVEFDPYNRYSDIALLKLNTSANLTNSVRTLCLPDDFVGLSSSTTCYTAGWGTVYPPTQEPHPNNGSAPSSSFTTQLRIPIVSNEDCGRTMNVPYPLTDKKICAGYRVKANPACLGDTGGPLVCQQVDGSWAATGITSYGRKCDEEEKFGVFTQTSKYIDWIRHLTGNCTDDYGAQEVGGFQ